MWLIEKLYKKTGEIEKKKSHWSDGPQSLPKMQWCQRVVPLPG